MDDKQAAIKKIEEKHNLYKRFFDCDDGREVLAELEKDCYVKGTTFSTEPAVLAYREGMRSVVLHIKTMLTLDTVQLHKQLEKEAEVKPYREQEM